MAHLNPSVAPVNRQVPERTAGRNARWVALGDQPGWRPRSGGTHVPHHAAAGPRTCTRAEVAEDADAGTSSPSGFKRDERRSLSRAIERMGSSRDQAILMLLMHTGARASTVAAAKLSKVTLRKRSGEIECDVSKGNRTYSVPLAAPVRDALRDWIAERTPVEHDRLLTSERLPYTPNLTGGGVAGLAVVGSLPAEGLLVGEPHKARHDAARRLLSGDGAFGRRRPSRMSPGYSDTLVVTRGSRPEPTGPRPQRICGGHWMGWRGTMGRSEAELACVAGCHAAGEGGTRRPVVVPFSRIRRGAALSQQALAQQAS